MSYTPGTFGSSGGPILSRVSGLQRTAQRLFQLGDPGIAVMDGFGHILRIQKGRDMARTVRIPGQDAQKQRPVLAVLWHPRASVGPVALSFSIIRARPQIFTRCWRA